MSGGKGYSLSLSDGTRWGISGDASVSSWVQRLAEIMELRPEESGSLPRMVFAHEGGIPSPAMDSSTLLKSWTTLTVPEGLHVDSDRVGIRIWACGKGEEYFCELKSVHNHVVSHITMFNALYPVFRRVWLHGGIPLHAALFEKDGKGVLLAASGGTGKSTCCTRLPSPWKALCDDNAVAVATDNGYVVHPFPTWNDFVSRRGERTWDVQSSVPLHAVFFLVQSETDRAIPLSQGKAASLINQSGLQICEELWHTMGRDDIIRDRRDLFTSACTLSRKVPSFLLHASLHGRFWDVIEEALGWRCTRK